MDNSEHSVILYTNPYTFFSEMNVLDYFCLTTTRKKHQATIKNHKIIIDIEVPYIEGKIVVQSEDKKNFVLKELGDKVILTKYAQ